jgi:hypothetical protein
MKDDILQRKELYSEEFGTTTGHCEDVPQSQNSRTSRRTGDL